MSIYLVNIEELKNRGYSKRKNGLLRELRRANEREVAEIFETIDTFRAGRWYGSKGNGDVVKKCIESIESVRRWAQK